MSTQLTTMTVTERAKRALVVTKTEDELKALAAKSLSITTITNDDGREQVHVARVSLKNTRVEIQRLGKEARDDATKFSKAVIAEEKRLIALIEPEEERLQKLQNAYDEAIQAEKQARIDAEMKRVADLQERLAELRGNRMLTPTSGADLIAEHIKDIEEIAVDESFEEFREQAEAAKTDGLKWLSNLHAAAAAHETEQARIVAEREELARLRAEEEKRQAAERARIAEEERQAKIAREIEDAKHAEELRQRQEAQAKADAEAKRLRDEEAAKHAAELKAQREKQEAEAAAERKRIADEEAVAKAIRDAEAAKLAAERAEFERQQAETRRAKEEEERGERERSRLASIKKPADEEIIGVLARHYNVPASKVIEWVPALGLSKDVAA